MQNKIWINYVDRSEPLRNNKEYRYLYFGQFISFFWHHAQPRSVAISSIRNDQIDFCGWDAWYCRARAALAYGFIGGALLTSWTVKRCLFEPKSAWLFVVAFCLATHCCPDPHLWFIYVMAALMSALNGLHRPSLDAMIPRLVKHHEIQATSVLSMFKSVTGMVGGPALAGLCISHLVCHGLTL